MVIYKIAAKCRLWKRLRVCVGSMWEPRVFFVSFVNPSQRHLQAPACNCACALWSLKIISLNSNHELVLRPGRSK